MRHTAAAVKAPSVSVAGALSVSVSAGSQEGTVSLGRACVFTGRLPSAHAFWHGTEEGESWEEPAGVS